MTDLIQRRCRLMMTGYAPIPIIDRSKAPAIEKWQTLLITNGDEIALWSRLYPSARGTGTLCKKVPGLDIDILNEEAAVAAEEYVRERYEEAGYILVRIGRAPKRAILFRTDEPFKKVVINLTAPNGSAEKIEFLGDGQQVVVDGIHPDTGEPYSWHGGSPFEIAREELPYIREAEALALVEALAEMLITEFGYLRVNERTRKPNGHDTAGAAGGSADWQFLLDRIRAGESLHDSLRDLAAKMVKSGMSEGAAVNFLYALMDASSAPRDQRWQERRAEIPRLVDGAADKFREPPPIEPDDREARHTRPDSPAGVLPGTDYADMSTISAKRWLVHHLLAFGEVSVLYGEPGSGKSVLAEDIGLHIAAGMDWHGRTVKQMAVLYVALERAGVVARRALAFGIEHDTVAAALPFKMIRGPLDFRDPNVAQLIVATIADLAKRYGCEAGLLVVDTVSRALCGGDENSPKDMGQLIANLGRIQGALDIHLLLTHHQPAEKERMRGHGALLGAVDTTVHVTKSATGRLAEVVKSSDFEEGQRIAFSLKSVTISQDEYGDPTTAPVVIEETVQPQQQARKGKLSSGAKTALNALQEAIGEMGAVPPASNHIPPATKAVTIEQWRVYAYRLGISTSTEPRSRQLAFERATTALAAGKFIGVWEPHVWIA